MLKDLKPKASDVITYGKGGSLKYIQIEYEILGTLENMLINNSEQEVLKRIADFVTDEVGEEHVDKAMEIIQKAKDNDDGEQYFEFLPIDWFECDIHNPYTTRKKNSHYFVQS